ncbi:Pol Polyprotein [Phytophthora cinnamomi]|uniref:Pol Polyprotein n=1 Tax=Phytophthora cinnamomi TaxID=4785 RepID=UPI003559AC4D|nr:Pol Polyprotein [Phytophthora cinnamomi]
MSDEITFTKANGTVVKKKVPDFRNGDWKALLIWVLNVQEFQAFMGYTLDQGDQWVLAEDMQILLFEEDQRYFNDIFREEAEFRPNITVIALKQLTARHGPPGTRGVLMDELMQLRKKKGTSSPARTPACFLTCDTDSGYYYRAEIDQGRLNSDSVSLNQGPDALRRSEKEGCILSTL